MMPILKPFDFSALCQSGASAPLRHVGVRFDDGGRFLPEAGNTVVRHVIPGSPTAQALAALRDQMMILPWAHRFAWTDTESYHMTVFGCAIETGREAAYWPQALPLDTPLGQTTLWIDERLATFKGPGPFTMALHQVTPFGLTVTGRTAADEATARQWRDDLAVAFDRRSPGHDTYIFHITMAYIIEPMLDDMMGIYRDRLGAWTAELRDSLSALDLGPPAFCTFKDMNWFEPVRVLAGTGLPTAVSPRGV